MTPRSPTIILASQSPARARLLARLGFEFETQPAHLDENAIIAKLRKRKASPRTIVRALARAKAAAVAQAAAAQAAGSRNDARNDARNGVAIRARGRDIVVIGSDQMLVLGAKMLGKPQTARRAVEQLLACSGRQVELLTAVTVTDANGRRRRGRGASRSTTVLDVTKMKFRKLTRAEAQAYVRADQPLECAGSFMFEKRGISLFESVRTSDPTAIEGLPAMATARLLRRYSSKA